MDTAPADRLVVKVWQPVGPFNLRSWFQRRIIALLIALDISVNALLGGEPYQTISCRVGESIDNGGWASKVPWPAAVRDHCLGSVYQTTV